MQENNIMDILNKMLALEKEMNKISPIKKNNLHCWWN